MWRMAQYGSDRELYFSNIAIRRTQFGSNLGSRASRGAGSAPRSGRFCAPEVPYRLIRIGEGDTEVGEFISGSIHTLLHLRI